MKNFGDMMKKAQEMQAKMGEMQAKMAAIELSGTAGGGLVEVTLNGKFETRRVRIDRTLLKGDEGEVLEDLLVAAFNDARAKVEARMAQEMGALTGGLQLPPGFKLPF
jgi:nucleoid-associated protein EbfC